MSFNHVIVIGGGLAGLSTAHSAIEHGAFVTVLDKSAFLGGNSTKATSGINATYTQAQADAGVRDSVKLFESDTNLSFYGHGNKAGAVSPIVNVLTRESAPAVDWLVSKFGLDLSIVGFMGGQSAMRTHRGKEKFPGMTITYALIDALEKIQKAGGPARIVTKARVTELVRDSKTGVVSGVKFTKDGASQELRGAVVIATGGYGADFSKDSILARHRPDLLDFSTTNGDHCTGDGIKMAETVGAGLKDITYVQVHPTGLVHPDDPNSKIKFLAAEALRGTGALVLDAMGKRFMNELGMRSYCTAMMQKNKGPFRLVLNSKCSKEIMWHCKHYKGRGLMKFFAHGNDLAKELGVSPKVLQTTFEQYNAIARGELKCRFGKKKQHVKNTPFDINDNFYVAVITPVVHYCMGGVAVNEHTEVLDGSSGAPIKGLFVAGEAAGGVHGKNRLGGNSLLDCVVFGRIAGQQVCRHLLQHYLAPNAQGRLDTVAGQLQPQQQAAAPPAAPQQQQQQKPKQPLRKITKDEAAKHNTESDCWVIVGEQVLDVTKFLSEHPGGKKAIMLFAGKDATEEFDMLHQREVIEKYAPESVIGTVA